MSVPTLTITPSGAADAYSRVQAGVGQAGASGEFGAVLGRVLGEAMDAGHTADTQTMQAMGGHGNLTDVVTAVSKAELALQSAVAIRDKVVSAYQDIMHMAI